MDKIKAWEIPRQFSFSAGFGSSRTGSDIMLENRIINEVDIVFQSRNRVLNEMKQTRERVKKPSSRKKPDEADKKSAANSNNDDEEDNDDDIFGGLDEYTYVPAAPKKD